MKTPKDFDYDLWTSTDGRYFIRIKSTGETCEINHETMRLLRNEEKKLRRELQGITISVPSGKEKVSIPIIMLSLDSATTDANVQSSWLVDPTDYEKLAITGMMEQEFCKLLTQKQRDVYIKCLIGGMPITEYARENSIRPPSVSETIHLIRKKAKKFFAIP